METKTKIAIAVAGIVALGALALVVLSHRAAAQAQAQDTSASDAGMFPALLMQSSPAAQPMPSQIAGAGSTISDPTTGGTPAPDSSLSTIAAALATVKQQSAADLFKSLPQALGAAGIQTYSVSQTTPEGVTSLTANATYNPAPPPPAAAPPKENHFIWQGTDFGTSANFISQQLANYVATTGQGPGPEVLAQLQSYVKIGMTDPRNQP